MASLIQAIAVSEYRSFHRAALAIGTSQSSVSARMKALEEDLGITLFERNTRGVQLTEAGRHFIDQINAGIDILDHAIKTAGMRAGGEVGEIRVGVHALMSGCFLDRLLRNFHSEYGGIRLIITESTARDAKLMVREGKLDIAFMACIQDIPDLNSRVIWGDRLIAALPACHSLSMRTNLEWKDIANETFLVRNGGVGPQLHDMILARAAGKCSKPEILNMDVGRDTLLSMIASGHGISLLVRDLQPTYMMDVVFLPIADEPEPIAFSTVWSPGNRDPALLNLLALATRMGRTTET
ncbi:MAG: LysR family transcriptional regulator [Rhizobium pusense]|nr:LysR family transcriptional regulator [Agrobacterium pusense]